MLISYHSFGALVDPSSHLSFYENCKHYHFINLIVSCLYHDTQFQTLILYIHLSCTYWWIRGQTYKLHYQWWMTCDTRKLKSLFTLGSFTFQSTNMHQWFHSSHREWCSVNKEVNRPTLKYVITYHNIASPG